MFLLNHALQAICQLGVAGADEILPHKLLVFQPKAVPKHHSLDKNIWIAEADTYYYLCALFARNKN